VTLTGSPLYTFKNFTDMTAGESEEVLRGRNDPEVRRWMTSDRLISEEDHRRFMKGLKSNPRAVYIRIERAGVFAGVYSLNDIDAGSGLGGFWVTSHTRERLLPLNVVFQGMDYMFRVINIDFIYGFQKIENLGAIRINTMLGINASDCNYQDSTTLQRIEITRQQWQSRTISDAKLLKLMNRMEQLNGTS
jgi:RimJ/RimL family protein N-acetyltransferase